MLSSRNRFYNRLLGSTSLELCMHATRYLAVLFWSMQSLFLIKYIFFYPTTFSLFLMSSINTRYIFSVSTSFHIRHAQHIMLLIHFNILTPLSNFLNIFKILTSNDTCCFTIYCFTSLKITIWFTPYIHSYTHIIYVIIIIVYMSF